MTWTVINKNKNEPKKHYFRENAIGNTYRVTPPIYGVTPSTGGVTPPKWAVLPKGLHFSKKSFNMAARQKWRSSRSTKCLHES